MDVRIETLSFVPGIFAKVDGFIEGVKYRDIFVKFHFSRDNNV